VREQIAFLQSNWRQIAAGSLLVAAGIVTAVAIVIAALASGIVTAQERPQHPYMDELCARDATDAELRACVALLRVADDVQRRQIDNLRQRIELLEAEARR
jgi:hypothetical protein